jgi:hypothetical protein
VYHREQMADPLKLQDQLRGMPEWQRLAELRGFGLGLEIFQRNARDFRALLEMARGRDAIERLWALQNRPRLEEFQREVARHLHNFVTAAFSLVDHARRFFEKYQTSGAFPDYAAEVKTRFADAPVCQFVQGLRNYSTHKKVPTISSTMEIAQGKGMTHTIYLPKDELLEGFDWNVTARRFLEGAGDKIDLVEVAAAYTEKVTEFYKWVFTRLEQIHAADIRAVAEKQDEVRRAFGEIVPRSLEADLQIAAQIRVAPEQLFLAYLDPVQWSEICQQKPDAVDRANALLDAVEAWSQPLTGLRDRFVELFRKYYAAQQGG